MTRKLLWTKASCIAVLLVSTAFLLARRGDRELIVPHPPLAQFPEMIGEKWNGRTVGIDPQVIDILGAGDFAERSYQSNAGEAPVDLFVGYFPTQRTGVSIHSPKNCLPGSGWAPVESKYVTLSFQGEGHHRVNEYVIQKGDEKQLVLYWYQTHGRLIANEYVAKFYLVADSIRMNRSDAALVRIITPITGDENAATAEKRAIQFATTLMPELRRFIPA